MKTHRFRKGYPDGKSFPSTRSFFVVGNQRRLEASIQHLKECIKDPDISPFRVKSRDRTFCSGTVDGSLEHGPFPPHGWSDLYVSASREVRIQRLKIGRVRKRGSDEEKVASLWYLEKGRFGHGFGTSLGLSWAVLWLILDRIRRTFPATYQKRRRYLERREAKKRARARRELLAWG